MTTKNVILGFTGYILTVGVAPVLFIEQYYFLGVVSMILGIGIIDYNRSGN